MVFRPSRSERYELGDQQLVVAEVVDLSGNPLTFTGVAPSDVTPVAITYTTGNPNITPDGAITIANGATPTVSELLQFCVELNTKVDALADALADRGITV